MSHRHAPTRHRTPARRRGGFTFPELIMGMAVTTVVLIAMGAMTTAVAKGWTEAAAAGAEVQYVAASARLQRELQGAKYVGRVERGGGGAAASIVFWQADDYPGGAIADADGRVQYAECAVLEYDPAARAVYRYQVNGYDTAKYARLTAAQRTALSATVTHATLSGATAAATVKNFGWTAVPSPNAVATPLERIVLLRDVSAVEWAAVGGDATPAVANVWRPLVEYSLTFQPPATNGVAARPLTVYGTATLRGARVKPN
jgi:hypothetical protein